MHTIIQIHLEETEELLFFYQQGEIREKEQKLELLQNKVSELTKCYHSEDFPAKFQVFNDNKNFCFILIDCCTNRTSFVFTDQQILDAFSSKNTEVNMH